MITAEVTIRVIAHLADEHPFEELITFASTIEPIVSGDVRTNDDVVDLIAAHLNRQVAETFDRALTTIHRAVDS